MSLVQVLVLDWVISSQSRRWPRRTGRRGQGLRPERRGGGEACCSAWGAVWPPEAMRGSIQQAGPGPGSAEGGPHPVGLRSAASRARAGRSTRCVVPRCAAMSCHGNRQVVAGSPCGRRLTPGVSTADRRSRRTAYLATRGSNLKKRKFPAKMSIMSGELGSEARTMLLGFRAANTRSFRDQLEFSLEATAMSEPHVPRDVSWREDGRNPLRVLPAAGILGANASGKTNLLRVLNDMRVLVLDSFKAGSRSKRLQYHPFLLDPAFANAPSTYDIELIINGVRFEYGFAIDNQHVISEYARNYPHGKAVNIFRREGFEVYPGEKNRAKSRAVSEILRPNALYLSAAGAAEHPGLQPLYEWFEENLWLCETGNRERRWSYTTHLLSHENYRESIISMLRAADFGITDASLREMDVETTKRLTRIMEILQREMEFEPDGVGEHRQETVPAELFLRVALSHAAKHGSVELETRDESLGTLVWLGLIGPILDTLKDGTVLLVDEMESSLHPSLVAQLIRLFQNQRSNPNGAQIVFNSFEAGLLGNSVDDRILGRDQVWFTEKLNDGSTRLYPLTDLSPRKAEAIGQRYLSGRYGATPIISESVFASLAAMVSSGADK